MGANWQVLEGLYRFNMADYSVSPALAAGDPEKISDTEYEVKLRDGAKFSDGTPVTAADFVASYERATSEKSIYRQFFTFVDSVEAKDDNTITIKLKHPFANLKERFVNVRVVPASMDEDSLKAKPIGTGPYKYENITATEITAVPNENYNGNEPAKVSTIKWQSLKDDSARLAAAIGGTIDVMEAVPASAQDQLKGAGWNVESKPGYGNPFLMFNTQKAPFDKPEVRRAFLRAINRQALIDTDAVFLPGHTIVGNMHDEHLLEGSPSRNEVLTAAARHHSLLQGDRDAWRHLPLLRRAVVKGAQEVSFPTNPGEDLPGGGRCVQELLEWVNLQERQAKYINESFKAYEAFGYGWALPMLDTEMWRAWLRGSEELTATRDWYAQFTAEVYGEATGTASQLFEAPAARIPAGPRRALMAALTVTGTRTALSRAVSMRTMLRHPMAFEAFNAPMPYTEQILRMSRGATSTGLWTQLFLDGTWGAEPVVPMS